MSDAPVLLAEADPFELPEWLGTQDVVWLADTGLLSGHIVRGRLTSSSAQPQMLACDVVAVDHVFPTAATDPESRVHTHRAWTHGEIHLGWNADRLVLAVPGTATTAEVVLDALGRLARAVGGDPGRFAATLRVGALGSARAR